MNMDAWSTNVERFWPKIICLQKEYSNMGEIRQLSVNKADIDKEEGSTPRESHMDIEELRKEVFGHVRQRQFSQAEDSLARAKADFTGRALGRWHHLLAETVLLAHPDDHSSFAEACTSVSRLLPQRGMPAVSVCNPVLAPGIGGTKGRGTCLALSAT